MTVADGNPSAPAAARLVTAARMPAERLAAYEVATAMLLTPVFECGTRIGKVMRSLFLLDYLTEPDFRREVHKLLSQGEAVHLLQRALMSGNIPAKHGRTMREITAVSGALSLLTNIVMAWNTQAMQSAINRLPAERLSTVHLARIAPVAFRHINMNGKMRFALDNYAWLTSHSRRKAG
jgi:Tn3 transposase DDE domain